MRHIRDIGGLVVTVVAVGGFVACSDFLEVSDPSRFTDGDLDQALDAVANGAEGDLHGAFDDIVYTSALLGDEFQHTGTWAQWDDVDHGRIRYDQSATANGRAEALLRARYAAIDAQGRFERVLEGSAGSSEVMARVRAVEAWANLLLAQHFCEAPGEPGGAAMSDVELYDLAIQQLTTAISTADAAGADDYALWARAGRARANLMRGNFDAAFDDAQGVVDDAPAGWSYNALYTQGNLENSVVNLATITFNNAGGLREKWWNRVDVAERKLRDAFTDEPDPRIPIRRDAGVLGVDGVTDYYSQWKYTGVGGAAASIPLTHVREMRLIQAEVEWRRNNLPEAMTILNDLRTAAGLTTVAAATSDEVFDVLLNERFAELFMEAQRTNDLYRFDLFGDMVAAGDFVGSIANRAIKFPLTSDEGVNNQNIANDASQRCSPTL